MNWNRRTEVTHFQVCKFCQIGLTFNYTLHHKNKITRDDNCKLLNAEQKFQPRRFICIYITYLSSSKIKKLKIVLVEN